MFFSLASQKGFTLLEVLIAFFILSLGLLGIIQLQAVSLRQTQEAHLNTIAIFQAQNFWEQLRLYQISPTSQEATTLLQQWNQKNQQLLPDAEGKLQVSDSQLHLYLFWHDVTFNSDFSCIWFPQDQRTCLRWVGAYER